MKKSSTKDLDYLADQLDSRFRGPFGFRFGWDGLLGFVPGVGNFVTSLFSFYILLRAASLGAPPIVILRMGINVLIDNLVDKVPVLGLLFDFFWKANIKNVQLLKQTSIDPAKATWQSHFWVALILFIIFALFVAAIAAGFYALVVVIDYIRQDSYKW